MLEYFNFTMVTNFGVFGGKYFVSLKAKERTPITSSQSDPDTVPWVYQQDGDAVESTATSAPVTSKSRIVDVALQAIGTSHRTGQVLDPAVAGGWYSSLFLYIPAEWNRSSEFQPVDIAASGMKPKHSQLALRGAIPADWNAEESDVIG